MEKIEKFFNDEYIDIVETQLNTKEGDDFLTDETLKESIKVEIQQYITIYRCIRDVIAISIYGGLLKTSHPQQMFVYI